MTSNQDRNARSFRLSEKLIVTCEQSKVHKQYQSCLIYPDKYGVAMSSLGYLSVYSSLNQSDIPVDRGFFDDSLGNYSIEQRRGFNKYKVLFVSMYFEEHLVNLIKLLMGSNIEPMRKKRQGSKSPFIILGGPLVSINEKASLTIADAIYKGELNKEGIEEIKSILSNPEEYEEVIDKTKSKGKWIEDYAASPIITPFSHFKDMFLIQVQRGCPNRCRFCSAGNTPLSFIREEDFLKEIKHARGYTDRLGIIGLALHTHPSFKHLLQEAVEMGFTLGLSSLRLDHLDEEILSILKEGGVKTISIGLESGSNRILEGIDKGFRKEDFLELAGLAKKYIDSLKVYIILGFPDEDMGDIIETMDAIRDFCSVYKSRVELSINPFVPKPGTPFAHMYFIKREDYKKKISILRKGLLGLPVKFHIEGYNPAREQFELSWADEGYIEKLCQRAKSFNLK